MTFEPPFEPPLKCVSYTVSPLDSLPPQLIDTAPPPPATTARVAMSTAANRSTLLFAAASTSAILASGAMAWAHSMSRAASCAQPQFAFGCLVAYTSLKHPLFVVQAGSLHQLEKTFKSFSAVG